MMFCPKCGTLSYPNWSLEIRCSNYHCKYAGDASNILSVGINIVDTARIKHTLYSPEIGYDRDGRRRGAADYVTPYEHLNSINKANYNEWRDMKEGWSFGNTQYDVHNN